MKLSRLLEQHGKFADQGLAESFGDGYLIAHNRLYKNIRKAVLAAGYKLSSERNEAYETFPLLQLERLLAQKTLPYSNNLSGFQNLAPRELEVLTWEDLEGNLKKNFVFHEGVHAVVRTIANKHLPTVKPGADIESQRLFTLRMLLEESCANTFELLGVIDAGDATHRAFYELNSYVVEFENRSNLKKAWEEIGSETLIKFMILSYVQSNFLRERIDENELKRMIQMSSETKDEKHLKTLRALAKIAFNLNERFRFQTTGFHLRLAGVTIPLEDALDFDFLESLQKLPGFQDFVSEVARLGN